MKVFQWQADTAGTGFYRMTVPGQALALRGHRVIADSHMAPSFVAGAQVIVGQRVSNSGPTNLWRDIRESTNFKLVFDCDDDYLSITKTDRVAYDFFSNPEIRDNLIQNISNAHRVTCASRRLVEIMSQYNKDVVYIPNSLPANLLTWDVKRERDNVVAGESKNFVIGMVLTSSTLHDGLEWLHIAREYIAKHRDRRNMRLHIIGPSKRQLQANGFNPDRIPGELHDYVRVTPFIEGTINYLRAVDFDVWLAPYRDTPFNDAKFPTKALEAAFLGIPLIADGVRPYQEWSKFHAGRGIILTSRPAQLRGILTSLTAGSARRRSMSRDARRVAVQHIAEYRALAWERALSDWRNHP